MSKEELKKQIELLVKDDEKSQETIIKQSQEIERLNNIIKQYDKVSFIHEMELQKRIDKAIEFIYENAYNEERNYQIDDLWYEIPKLLDILKGEKND